ncbi:sensor histidine kinase [Piscinibacter terrae]|uniref:histidine kinase n=1 Tax=Piscinibacter terrae TaxID=2496871 RepID=A0A3N7JZ25_9BURK|nr:sensor histidine kinase [Albitalea terrae]RQP24075.1 sensor histidine kinase [Albitalea terrae]
MVSDPSSSAVHNAQSSVGAFFSSVRRGFIAYARWLDSITWTRFFLYALLAMIMTGIASELPPFSLKWGDDIVVYDPPKAPKAAKPVKMPPVPPSPSASGSATPPMPPSSEKTPKDKHKQRYDISIDKDGVHITPVPESGASAPAGKTLPSVSIDKDGVRAPGVLIDKHGVRIGPSARAAASAASAAASADAGKTQVSETQSGTRVDVHLPPNATTDEIRDAIEEAKDAIREAIEQAAEDEAEAAKDAARAAEDAAVAAEDGRGRRRVISAFRPGDHMPGFMMLIIVMSMVIKIMAAGRFKAEAQAVEATEMAESEALKRQVVEARMAAMQAQVEPHFLFNTLASIDHLIETDPPRASKMQKNLIALLRASMPTMREANAQGTRDLGRELAVIRPYLEILKVRMEERLQTEINVPDGLLSADFPPMMLQGLVENAIKHGLEPKAEGGRLTVKAEIVHGKLQVTVADTGLGFGKAATAGTGIGLNNIRERLQLLYGRKASLVISEPEGGGTAVSITVPYATSNHPGADA